VDQEAVRRGAQGHLVPSRGRTRPRRGCTGAARARAGEGLGRLRSRRAPGDHHPPRPNASATSRSSARAALVSAGRSSSRRILPDRTWTRMSRPGLSAVTYRRDCRSLPPTNRRVGALRLPTLISGGVPLDEMVGPGSFAPPENPMGLGTAVVSPL
jgi:hypothetical protein